MSRAESLSWSEGDLRAFDHALLLLEAQEQAAGDARDGVAWVRRTLGGEPWSIQRQIIDSVRDNRYTAVQACHGPGKSKVASWIAAWWISTHPPGSARVVSTAPTGDQVKGILWSEINIASMQASARGHPLPGRVLATEWKFGQWIAAIGRKPSDHNTNAFQGFHARYLLVIIDESCGVISQFWTAALALMTGDDCRALFLGNPDDPSSEFRRWCDDQDVNTIRISAFDTPNFTGEPVSEDVAAHLVNQEYVDKITRRYGVTSPTYISKVLGEFPDDSDDGVIMLSDLRRCAMPVETPRTLQELLPVHLGIDFGAGGDETSIRERRGTVVGREWKTRSRVQGEIIGLCLEAIRESGASLVKCDVIGIGFGLVGWLANLHATGAHDATVMGINVSNSSSDPNRFLRLRSQLWWNGRELAQEGRWDFSGLDEDDREQLITQLTAPHYQLDASGRIVVEKKDETRERIGRSPDQADALLLAFFTPSSDPAAELDWLKAAKAARGA